MTTPSVMDPYTNGPRVFYKDGAEAYCRAVLVLLGRLDRDDPSWETKKERMGTIFMEHVGKFRRRMPDSLIVETYKDLTSSGESFDIV